MTLNFQDKEYSWKDLTLSQFLDEGNIPSNWKEFFERKDVLVELGKISTFLSTQKCIIYPPPHQVFRALYLTPLKEINVVILGQDPYHNGSAVGLCFSVLPGNSLNPSLRNMYRELKEEGYKPKEDGVLLDWAKQGVFLLNKALTVEKGDADSHTAIWYTFTDKLVEYISEKQDNVVWLLFGKNAQTVEPLIRNDTHRIIKTSHPSPYSFKKPSGGNPAFLGSNCFHLANKYLGKKGIVW